MLLALVGAVLVAMALVVAAVVADNTLTDERPVPTTRPTTNGWRGPGSTTEVSPELAERAELADVPLLDEEGVATHTHTLLRVVVEEGDAEDEIVVPADIGIDRGSGMIAALHTHKDDGIIHVESPTLDDEYSVGQLLTLWTGEVTPAAICAELIGEACGLSVAVVPPTESDRQLFRSYGRLDPEPRPRGEGLDLILDDKVVVEVRLRPSSEGSTPPATGRR